MGAPKSGIIPRWVGTSVLFFAAITFPCLVIYQGPYSSWIHPHVCQNTVQSSVDIANSSSPFDTTDLSSDSEEVRLKRVLKAASTNDSTVILAPLNEAWAAPNSMLDLFLESFRIGENTSRLLNHVVIVALDQKAYTRCLDAHPHCFALITEGLNSSKEAYFMTPNYMKVVWRKIDFLRSVLELGYNFVFTDGDIMWFRDPFPRFDQDADFQVACDNFLGNPTDLGNRPNTGLSYVKSNNRTIELYKFWYNSRNTYPRKHDQDVFNKIKFDPFFTELGLKIRFLNTAYFGGFCEPSRNLTEVHTMHANCCFGLGNKLMDITILLDDWREFKSLPPSVRTSWPSSWRVPLHCRRH